MRRRRTCKWLGGTLLALAMIVGVTVIAIRAAGRSPPGPPPPPTPGPPPTPEPYVIKWEHPIRTRDEAIEHALTLDAQTVTRKRPLTREMVDAHPGMVIIEAYETRREAFETYGFGVVTDPVAALEPVWVVMIEGRASVRMPGAGLVRANGVTLIFSQANGRLNGMAAGMFERQSTRSP